MGNALNKRGRPPGQPGKLCRKVEYKCVDCGQVFPREELFAKQARWITLGSNAKPIRARILKWICRKCMELDPMYNIPKWARNKTEGVKPE